MQNAAAGDIMQLCAAADGCEQQRASAEGSEQKQRRAPARSNVHVLWKNGTEKAG